MQSFLGEYLIPRYVGHFAIIASFCAACLATYAFVRATQTSKIATQQTLWQRIGVWSFSVHGVSVITVIICIFYVMMTKRFEYFYAHSHTDKDLPWYYVFAAFWEGQEGSFLLWMFWHVMLGGFLIYYLSKFDRKNAANNADNFKWLPPVVAVLSCIQIFLTSMILGVHMGWGEHIIKWGSNPILLLREANEMPFIKDGYVEKLAQSARGLNPLLQNYWMTIHPPTLFLGFASTSIPFCFAVAALWQKKYTQWLPLVQPFAFFSAAILGTGILMGGAWAYEALSFNGYWAWDAVENMSLVPWLVMVAGIHTHLIARVTGNSLRSTFVFYLLSFSLVLYSTFLTRSGILGETSVHAFTELGLENQLILFQVFFLVVAVYLFAKNYKSIPTNERDESVASKEFWMLIGALILVLSAVLMTFTTSIPVFAKVQSFAGSTFGFKTKPITSPIDPLAHYNKTQLWIAVSMGLITGFTQSLRFKEFNFANHSKKYLLNLAILGGISFLLAILVATVFASQYSTRDVTGTFENLKGFFVMPWQYALMLYAGVFTCVCNIDFIISRARTGLKTTGSAFSHLGFGILVVGILISGINKNWISNNRFAMEGIAGFTDEQFNKNILLIKGAPMFMSGYQVEYQSDTAYGSHRDYTLVFRKKSPDLKTTLDSFVTHPYVLYDKKTGKLASTNPDTRHKLGYDIFTYIPALPPSEQNPELAKREEDSLKYTNYSLKLDDSLRISAKINDTTTQKYVITLDSLSFKPKHPKYVAQENDIAVSAHLKFHNAQGKSFEAEPLVLVRGGFVYQLPATVNNLSVRVKLEPNIFDALMKTEQNKQIKELAFSENETQVLEDGARATFVGINAQPNLPESEKQAGDIAFSAIVKIEKNNQTSIVQPVYIIRDNQPFSIPADITASGLSLTITKVDPKNKKIILGINNARKGFVVPINIAENAPRTDYIVLEATVNPGINLVWSGCLLMLSGFVMMLFLRIRKH